MVKKILGLDLGISSIGWALIEVIKDSYQPVKIIAMGSRIIPLNSDERSEFQKGQSISKNQNRTTARTQRKGYDRKQLRKSNLKKILAQYNIFPSKELMNKPMLDLWKLRSDAVNGSEDISPEQLGRIFYMLNQKRGYKSARSEANMDKKDTEYVTEVKSRFENIKEKGKTIGENFYDELLIANQSKNYFRVKEKVFPREAYIEEFDKIVEVQKPKHSFLTDEVIDKLRNEIIFYQRKLKSQKGLVSLCEFESFEKSFKDDGGIERTKMVGARVAPRSSPLNQYCKIWETVNNISLKIKNPDGSKYKWGDWFPSFEEKEKIADYLNKNSILSFTKLLEIIGIKKENVYVNKQILKGLQGNLTYSAIYEIIGKDHPLLKFNLRAVPADKQAYLVDKKTGEILEERDAFVIDKSFEYEPLYQLWHTIYSIKDSDECKNALIKRFRFSEEIANSLVRIDFTKQSYANKSQKAIRKILPYLMQGFDYSQSCSLAGYNHSNSLTNSENAERLLKEKLSLIPKNGLRQPVVEKILNQMIHVVNSIIEIYGAPNEIRVELARELKQSKDERNDADIQNAKNKKLNEEIAKRLSEMGFPATKRYIQKYKFIFPVREKKISDAKVLNQCIYCGETFNLSDAMRGDNFDVDHIVPKALLFDDSQLNKVLVHRKCNSTKDKLTAYDYIANKGESALQEYLERVDDWYAKNVISYGKMLRLKVSHKDYMERKSKGKETEADKKLWENFIDRQLRESSYISRKAMQLLKEVCRDVNATEGTVTATLRKLWGWDEVLKNLLLPKYKLLNQTEIAEWESDFGRRKHTEERIANWDKRDDHRHHAIDALVVACTRQGFIQRINTLNSSETRNEMMKNIDESKIKFNEKNTLLENYLKSLRPFSTKEVEKEAGKILVSFKAGKKVATISKFKAEGKNKKKGVITPRGALHEQFVYGKIKVRDYNKPLKYIFENADLIIDKKIQKSVKERIQKHHGNIKNALSSLKKEPIFLDEEKLKTLETAHCYKDEFVIKYKLQDIKQKDIPFIVDEKIKQILSEKIKQHKGNEKEAFKDAVWFNEEKQIPIRTVRCFTGLSAVEPIKKNEDGENIGFAKTGNNHHIAFYKNKDEKVIQLSCTFWHAVERKKYKIPIIIKNSSTVWNSLIDSQLPQEFLEKLPEDGLELQISLQQNELFVLGLSNEDFEEAIQVNDKSLISQHLYLVWSVSDNDYWFRHHLETKNSELKKVMGARESGRYFRFNSVSAFLNENPKKIKTNHLGEIVKIGEY